MFYDQKMKKIEFFSPLTLALPIFIMYIFFNFFKSKENKIKSLSKSEKFDFTEDRLLYDSAQPI